MGIRLPGLTLLTVTQCALQVLVEPSTGGDFTEGLFWAVLNQTP